MNKVISESIVLSRINYGDNDRIVTVITRDQGKIRLIAKGSRKLKSKLAAGIELFSVSEISFIKGKGDIDTLVSSRGIEYFINIQKDLDKIKLAYEVLKAIDKYTEDNSGSEYYRLLKNTLKLANELRLNDLSIRNYFFSQLIKLSGFTPKLFTDDKDEKLNIESKYNFDLDNMTFVKAVSGRFDSKTIKYLRILFSDSPDKIFNIKDEDIELSLINNLIQSMFKRHLSV